MVLAQRDNSSQLKSDFEIEMEERRRRKAEIEAERMLQEKMPRMGCTIKGMVTRMGKKRTYYMPGTRRYERRQMSFALGDRWFCTPEDAEKAGFKPARR